MFDIATKNSFFDDEVFFRPIAMFNKTFKEFDKVFERGLPTLSRPHNLYTYKNDEGEIIGNKVEIVTTPFKKDEVTVEINGDILTVKCGTENKKEDDISAIVYHGISSQSYSFSLKLGEKVDIDSIEAKNEDGILTIKLPYKKIVKEEPRKIKVL